LRSRFAAAPLAAAVAKAALPVLALGLFHPPVLAHHPFGMGEGAELNGWQGVLSGIGHPLLGPDHLLFLVALTFVGLNRPRTWVLPLLAAGLAGSALSLLLPLAPATAPWAEALVALSLAAAGLMTLSALPAAWLLPLFGLHGYLLGGTIVGAEPTPLATYFLGLLLGQGAVLLAVTGLSQSVVKALGRDGRRLAAGIWIGLGCAFAWMALVA